MTSLKAASALSNSILREPIFYYLRSALRSRSVSFFVKGSRACCNEEVLYLFFLTAISAPARDISITSAIPLTAEKQPPSTVAGSVTPGFLTVVSGAGVLSLSCEPEAGVVSSGRVTVGVVSFGVVTACVVSAGVVTV